MSAAENKAVFLSYASQDAPAVERIAEALRAAGVEVWFDKNELVGGDAWDQKIRRQIASCALFVPVISAATQARGEGYFRLEWKLAVDRSHLMAHDQPFLLPVVVDATADAAARVPPEFRAVQWTRLPGGETPEKFCERVKTLLGGSAVLQPALDVRERGLKHRATPEPRTRWLLPTALGFAAIVALTLWQPWKNSAPALPPRPAAVAPSALALTPAQQLVAKARTILDQGDELNRETYALAEELLIKAEALDVTEASAWVLHASVSRSRIEYGLDRSAARFEAMRNQTGRAVQLAPESLDTQLAECDLGITFEQNIPDVINRLQALAVKYPDDWRVPNLLSDCYRLLGKTAEGLAANERALQLSPDNPRLKSNRINFLIVARRWAEAEASIAVMLRGRTGTRLLAHAVYLKLLWSGDLAGAASAVRSWPAWFLLEDRGVGFAAWVALWNRDPGGTLEVVRKFPRDYIRDYAFTGPTAVLSAWANEQAGNAESARADWRIVQQVAERELRAAPNDADALHWKAWALARLGDIPAATSILQQLLEKNYAMSAKGAMGQFVGRLGGLALAVGRTDLALAQIAQNPPGVRAITQTDLRLNPLFDSLRSDPRFQAAIAAALGPVEKKEAGATSAVTPNDKSVAVLAFANLSDDKSNEYFSDGISEELLNVLAKIPDLKVSARTSAFYFKGKQVPMAEIAKQLGVAYVVEGSVRKAGSQVRITAQLIKATDGFHVWSDTFTRELKDVFSVQDEIAGLIAKNLSLKIGVAATRAPTVNAEAYQHLFQARFFSRQDNNDGWTRCIAECKAALALDPEFAPAAAEMARSYIQLARFGGIAAEEGYRLARGPAELALKLDPNLAEAHDAMGWVQRTADWNWHGADASFRRAYELAPRNATMITDYAIIRGNQGYFDEARTLARQAIELDPLNATTRGHYALFLGWFNEGRQVDEAIAQLQRGLELSPNAVEWHAYLTRFQMLQGRLDQAAASAELEPSLRYRLVGRALVQVARKDRAGAEVTLRELKEKFSDEMSFYIAEIHAFAGENDRAFEWMERSRQHHETALCWILGSPTMEVTMKDPRWNEFLKKLGHDVPLKKP